MSRPMAASELPHCGNPKTNRIGDAANLPTIYYGLPADGAENIFGDGTIKEHLFR